MINLVLLDERSCVISGMVNKPETHIINEYMSQFGQVSEVKPMTNNDDTRFIVTFEGAFCATAAMNKTEHIIDGKLKISEQKSFTP